MSSLSEAEGWIDVTVSLRSRMVHWPGDPPVEIERASDMDRGDPANVTAIRMGAHTGTHMDAPVHFVPGGSGIDAMPLSAVLGKARVIEIADREKITVGELRRHGLRRGERILFKTANSSRCWQTDRFVEDFVYIPHETAEFLVEQGVRTVGVDYLSVGGFEKDGRATHRTLLGAGIWIIEGLDLSHVDPGVYEMLCLPLKIAGGDGAPARALLRKMGAAQGGSAAR